MDFTTLADEIAALAHRCWCRRMLQEGWLPGPSLDPAAKTHDALRPYGDLSPEDRARLRQCVTYDAVAESLDQSIAFALEKRELAARDLVVGMRVRQVNGDPDEVGTVVAWSLCPSEPVLLNLITVKWLSGDVGEYCPAEYAIEPLDDPAAG